MTDGAIQEGFEVFVSDHDKPFEAVRELRPHGRAEFIVYVVNAGDFTIPRDAVKAVHAQKVIVDGARLAPLLRRVIGQAHDASDPRI